MSSCFFFAVSAVILEAFYPPVLHLPIRCSSAYIITPKGCRTLVGGLLLGRTAYALHYCSYPSPAAVSSVSASQPSPISPGLRLAIADQGAYRLSLPQGVLCTRSEASQDLRALHTVMLSQGLFIPWFWRFPSYPLRLGTVGYDRSIPAQLSIHLHPFWVPDARGRIIFCLFGRFTAYALRC